VATKSPNPNVLIFDYSKHSSQPTDNICRPQHICHGHTSDGYGISWNPLHEGHLLSSSSDGTICHWDIKANAATLDIQPYHVYGHHGHHGKSVEDVDWHKYQANVFGSVGGDSSIVLWDIRDFDSSATEGKRGILKVKEEAHGASDDINCISFSPLDEFLFATGGSDGMVKLWDMRNLNRAIHTLEGHKAGVYQLNWSPKESSILASSSEDRRVNIWDISRIGQEQDPEDAEDGPPELLFIHGGHTAKVFDFSFNSTEDWFMSSVAEDNMLQIWKMASTIYEDDEEEDEENEDGEGSDDDINVEDLEAPEVRER
jgi:histone-binding protein RBBP4